MKYEEILKLYQKMGLDSSEKRSRLLRFSPDSVDTGNYSQVFIYEVPNSETSEEAQNAQLARDPE